MTAFEDLYRLGAAAAVTVASAAGAAVSTSMFGSQTYAIALSYPPLGDSFRCPSPVQIVFETLRRFLGRAQKADTDLAKKKDRLAAVLPAKIKT